MDPVLILDVSNLCYRNFYAIPHLSHKNVMTNVVFGLFRDILNYKEYFNTSRVVFCFDGPRSSNKRKSIYPEYKEHRGKNRTKEEERALEELYRQIKLLHSDYLPSIGYQNIHMADGFEGDDLIASVCRNLEGLNAIILSSDKDLYQLLQGNVSIFNIRKNTTFTLQRFKKEYGILPDQWAQVKALSGCTSDNIQGIKGIGEKTAIKYLSNSLPIESKAFKKIEDDASYQIYKRNIKLTRLPFKNTPSLKLRDDFVNQQKWLRVCLSLGFKSLKRSIQSNRRIPIHG